MKKIISLMLCMLMMLGAMLCFSPSLVAEAENIDTVSQTDVPKVVITTTNYVNVDNYVGCTIKIIDEKGGIYDEIYDEGASFKIRGNSTSSGEKKPFNIKFSSKTDVLGMGKNKKWCLLANCYEKTLIRNQAVLDFSSGIGLAFTPKYRVVDVYLNTRFLGSYLLTDPIQVASSRIDIDTDNNSFVLERDARTDEGTTYFESPVCGIRFGINEPETQTAEQYQYLMSFLRNAETAIVAKSYSEVEKYFDIDSMVDFYIVLEYFKNVDVDTGSTRFYITDGKIYGGPVWDFDLSAGNCLASYYTTYNNVGGSGLSYEGIWCQRLWYKWLWNYDEFREAVYARYLELQDDIVNLYSDNLEGKNYIDATVEEYAGTISRNYKEAGWSMTRAYSDLERIPDSTYEKNLEYYRNWLSKRNDWLLREWGLDSYITSKGSSSGTLNGFFITDVREKTTVSRLLSDYASGTKAFSGGNLLSGNVYIGNGNVLSVGGASYAVVVRGDPISDGVVSISDYVFVKRCCLGTVSADYMQSKSADCSGNGIVDAVDYVMIKRYCLGTYDIYS